jgi:general secretion pathway protein B
MSSILEALKKLEEEKATRRSGMGNLAGKVATTGRRSRQTPVWLLPGSMLAVAIVSVLLTYFAMHGISSRSSEQSTAKKSQDTAPIQETRLPPMGIPVTDAPDHRQPVLPPEKKTSGISTHPPVTITGKASPAPHASAMKELPSSPVPAKSLSENAVPPPPALIVTGIAWQKDNVNRMAVVNATPVREGGIVDGAAVKEILPDRVRFSLNGKEFEVSLER